MLADDRHSITSVASLLKSPGAGVKLLFIIIIIIKDICEAPMFCFFISDITTMS